MQTTNFFFLLSALWHHLYRLLLVLLEISWTTLLWYYYLTPGCCCCCTYFAFANNHSFFFQCTWLYKVQQHSQPSFKTKTRSRHNGAVLFFFPVGQSSTWFPLSPLTASLLRRWIVENGGEKITKLVTLFGWFDANDDARTHTHTHSLKHTDCCYWWSWFCCCCCNCRILNEIGVVGGVDTFCCLHRRWPRWSAIVFCSLSYRTIGNQKIPPTADQLLK